MTRLRAALPAKSTGVVHSAHLIDVIGRVPVETIKWRSVCLYRRASSNAPIVLLYIEQNDTPITPAVNKI